eukprot:TRINITY_DN56922_c1_g1_i1.p1 TRINITY_DN56922_c1_g1~~TRINITY_DN56922_c1_g1_i1.p1  ORF type:complete len:360 (+),score=55.22 TRINITY_DN56922_c1_g1_i1:65-1081(+)
MSAATLRPSAAAARCAAAAFSASRRHTASTVSGHVRDGSSVRATFNYCAGEAQRVLVTCPFEGDGFNRCVEAGVIEAVEHHVCDGRQEPELLDETGLALRRRGFCLVKHPVPRIDWQNTSDVELNYYPELVKLAKSFSGASRAAVASHVLRKASLGANPGEGAVRGGAYFVHNDFSDVLKTQFEALLASGKECLLSGEHFGLTEAELRTGRLMVFNFWRPINRQGPLDRTPLGIVDATSFGRSEYHVYEFKVRELPPNYALPWPIMLTLPQSSPHHRWYYFSGQQESEVIVIKTYDSAAAVPSNGVAVHSAFDLPNTPADSPPRESIEARVVCWSPAE